MNEIDEGVARRVLEVVDAGLVAGLGEPIPGKMGVEAAVCYALGLPHGDDPPCVAPAVRWLMIRLNAGRWSSPLARSAGLRRLAIAALGSRGVLDEVEFASRVTRLAIQFCVPAALRAAAQRRAGAQRERLLHAAALCERDPSRENALEAHAAAHAAYAAHAADDAAYYAAHAAADDAAHYAADSADSAAAADAPVNDVLNTAKALAAYDDALAAFAERVVHVLRDMGAPGTAYLYLTEVP